MSREQTDLSYFCFLSSYTNHLNSDSFIVVLYCDYPACVYWAQVYCDTITFCVVGEERILLFIVFPELLQVLVTLER
jgi:hypothetical protein